MTDLTGEGRELDVLPVRRPQTWMNTGLRSANMDGRLSLLLYLTTHYALARWATRAGAAIIAPEHGDVALVRTPDGSDESGQVAVKPAELPPEYRRRRRISEP